MEMNDHFLELFKLFEEITKIYVRRGSEDLVFLKLYPIDGIFDPFLF